MSKKLNEIKDLAEFIYDTSPCAYFDEEDAMHVAEELHREGYRKQNAGKWEIVIGSNGKEKMVCTHCRHQQDLASTFTYCPNCGARMRGVIR
jgi:Zn finger protein HypA/HybF involved in hydrogenase expression